MNELIVGSAHERVYVDPARLPIERIAENLPDRQAAIEYRRALVERSQLRCMQSKAASRHVRLQHRRLLQPRKFPLRIAMAGVHLDIDSGDEGRKSRDALRAD